MLKRKKYKGLIIKIFLQTLAVNGLEIILLLLANKLSPFYCFSLVNVGITLVFVGYGVIINKETTKEVKLKKEKFVVNEAHKKFINALDNKIYSEKQTETNKAKQPIKLVTAPREAVEHKSSEPDYSHVKNVLERLGYYNLNSQEKKQLEELKHNLIMAENGNNKQEKINEGLGLLLKIMAKYKV